MIGNEGIRRLSLWLGVVGFLGAAVLSVSAWSRLTTQTVEYLKYKRNPPQYIAAERAKAKDGDELDKLIAEMPPQRPELPVSALLLLGVGFVVPWGTIRSVAWVVEGFHQNGRDSGDGQSQDRQRQR